MDFKMDHLSLYELRAGRGLSKSPQFVFCFAKRLKQQLLKEGNDSINNNLAELRINLVIFFFCLHKK